MKQKIQNQKRPKTKVLVSRKTVKVLSHPIAKKLRLIRHAHSGKLVHSRHSSYAILMIFLAITGFFIFVSYNITSADSQSDASLVSATVNGPPPTVGAVITTPKSGDAFKSAFVDVEGTCANNSEVVVYSNSTLVGSALCTSTQTFKVQIQLFVGANSLTALNYDTINQAGPVTAAVSVTYNPTTPVPSPTTPMTPLAIYPIAVPGVTPKPPVSCATGSNASVCNLQYVDTNTCSDYALNGNLPKSPDVRVAIVCIPRYVYPSDTFDVGIVVWGGQAPYAMTVKWGDNITDTVKSISKPGYYLFAATYKDPGNYIMQVRVSDSNDEQAYMQAGIQVSGGKAPLGAQTTQNFIQYILNSFSVSWFSTPVPTYLLAVAVVLGFWAGDYFERSIIVISNRVIVHRKRRRHA